VRAQRRRRQGLRAHTAALHNSNYVGGLGVGAAKDYGGARQHAVRSRDRHGYPVDLEKANKNVAPAYHNYANLMEKEGDLAIAGPAPVARSVYNLALLLREGRGLWRTRPPRCRAGKQSKRQHDLAKPFQYYKVAARRNHVRANWVVADMLWRGRGVPQDRRRTFGMFEFLARK
jgi:TPR repeat protein